MSIRFTCLACRTVLKIGEMIAEPRKVRCTGCGIVIVVSPDEDDPTSVVASIPQQAGKSGPKSKPSDTQRYLVLGGGIVAGVILILGGWWLFSGPSDRGAVEGEVTVDNELLQKGEIRFTSLDGKGISTVAPIKEGRYRLAASVGPAIGLNRVEIKGERATGKQIPKLGGAPGELIDEFVEAVPERYNTKTTLKEQINRGANAKDFRLTSR